MFLTDSDYESHQMKKNLEILTKGDQIKVRNFAERAAQEEMRSYLKLRYDTNQIFINVGTWNNSKTYNELDHVIHEDILYYANTSNVGQNPTSGDKWTLGDFRNSLIVMRMVDIVVYHMYAKIPNRQTPEDVGIRYEEAIKWLKGVSKGEYSPNLPEIDNNLSSNILFGGEPKISWK